MVRVVDPNELRTPFGGYPKISWEALGIAGMIDDAVIGQCTIPFVIHDHAFRNSKFRRTITGRKNFATLLISIGREANDELYVLTTQSEDVCTKVARAKQQFGDYMIPAQAKWVISKQTQRPMIVLVSQAPVHY